MRPNPVLKALAILALMFGEGLIGQTNTFPNSGNVGIGTLSPGNALDVIGGTIHSDSLLVTGDGYWSTQGVNHLALSTFGGAVIRGSTINVGSLTVGAWTASAPFNGLFVAGGSVFTGNVGIGTTNPTYPLSVNGAVEAKEVVVQTGWSDYVFDPGYQMEPLAKVEQTIKTEKHLPGIPSAKEVAAHGVNLGDMEAKLLAKVEELTLRQIDEEKRIKALEDENRILRQENQKQLDL
jgi:hypothetical protein